MQEVFKDIPWYKWLYQASNLWNIKSLKFSWWKNKKILSQWKLKKWYNIVALCKNKKIKSHSVHRLVCLTFIWESNLDVNHKNWIKTDNRLENLEYTTRKENINHKYNVLWYKTPKWKFHHSSINILQFSKNNVFIKKWWSMREIERFLNIPHWNISLVCKWKRKTAGWFIFKFSIN